MQNSPSQRFRLVVVAPVYDDATAAAQLLRELDAAFANSDVSLRILLVDDGSPVPLSSELQLDAHAASRVDVLRLRRNVGHQRAIALGSAFVHEHVQCDAMIVMDADGEDRPEDAVRLVKAFREQASPKIVFAERTRRTESTSFKVFYRAYQLLHWLLTGIRVRVGNFSIVPASQLPALVTLPALWNHYAAAIFQARLPREMLPTPRGVRYSGVSKMNLVSLVMHGLQAISVFIDVVTIRMLLSIGLVAGASIAALLAMIVIGLFGGMSAPAWTPLVSTGLVILIFSAVLGCFSLALGSLAGRKSLDFIPVRDYRFFVEAVRPVGKAEGSLLFSSVPVHSEEHNFQFGTHIEPLFQQPLTQP